MKKAVRGISLGLAVCLLAMCLCSCDVISSFRDTRSDEEKIRDRVSTFATAINTGDTDTAISCLDARSRNMLNAAVNIGGGILGAVIGFELNVQDLFALALGFSGSLLSVDVQNVEITSDTKAVVYLTAAAKVDGVTETWSGALDMIKEGGDWFIYFDMDLSSLLK